MFETIWKVFCRLPSYEIRDGMILVRCTVGSNQKVALRCKIWPTPKNFGLNKIEATLNGAFLWKKGLWWYNAKSSRDFTIDDEITLTAEWHVSLRVPTVLNKHALPSHDPRRHQGPFCVEYLALKEDGHVLIEYTGDKMPLPENPVCSRPCCPSLHLLKGFSINPPLPAGSLVLNLQLRHRCCDNPSMSCLTSTRKSSLDHPHYRF